jgi:hypothetical protein
VVIPLLWINLQRHQRRRRRMLWALEAGGWQHERIEAVDALDPRERLLPIPQVLAPGNTLPGIQRASEADPQRRVLRPELACMASWLRALCRAEQLLRDSGQQQVLVLEDDSGASLACPEAWAFSLPELVQTLDAHSSSSGEPWAAVQLLATSRRAQERLLASWRSPTARSPVAPRQSVRTGGTGAVLLHRRALPMLVNRVQRWLWQRRWPLHLLVHPHGVRPVADKWLYGSLPAQAVWVGTYPLFCLDASDSAIHPEHLEAYQAPSRAFTLDTWAQDQRLALLEAQRQWDALR